MSGKSRDIIISGVASSLRTARLHCPRVSGLLITEVQTVLRFRGLSRPFYLLFLGVTLEFFVLRILLSLSFRILVLLVVVFVLHARGDSASSARMPSSLSSVILLINRLLFGIFCVHFLSGFSAPSRHPSQGYLCAPGQLPSPWKTADTLGLRIVTG